MKVRKFIRFLYRMFPVPNGVKTKIQIFLRKRIRFFDKIAVPPNYWMIKRGITSRKVAKIVLAEAIGQYNNISVSEHKIAVVLHLYYYDLWEEISGHLKKLDVPFDLHVSIPDTSGMEVEDSIKSLYPDSMIYRVKNRGRDICPFLQVMNMGALDKYFAVCKIHSKKSPHLGEDGGEWRRDLYSSLLGGKMLVSGIISLLKMNRQIGIIGPNGHILDTESSTCDNKSGLEKLYNRIGIAVPPKEKGMPPFFGGSMFWFRPAALRPLVDANLQEEDFEVEKGQVNGTLAHTIERFFSVSVEKSNHIVASYDETALYLYTELVT